MTTASAVFAFGEDAKPSKLWHAVVFVACIAASFLVIMYGELIPAMFRTVATMSFLAAIIMLGEISSIGWNRSSFRKIIHADSSIRRDVFWFFAHMSGVVIVINAGIFGLFSQTTTWQWIKTWNDDFSWAISFNLIGFIPSYWGRMIVGFMLGELVGYWIHRIEHHRVFWPLHEMHHSSTSMVVVSNYRENPFTFPIISLLTYYPMLIIGVEPITVAAYAVITQLWSLSLHGQADWQLGYLTRWVVFAPRHHWAHHKAVGVGGNYGVIIQFWDRVFETYEEPVLPIAVGVADGNLNQIHPILEPFVFLIKIPKNITAYFREQHK